MYIESIKIIFLHVNKGNRMSIKRLKKDYPPIMNRFKGEGLSQH